MWKAFRTNATLQISQLKSKLFPDSENQKAQDVQLLQVCS